MLATMIVLGVLAYAGIAGVVHGAIRDRDFFVQDPDGASIFAGFWPVTLPLGLIARFVHGTSDRVRGRLKAAAARKALPEARLVSHGE